MQAPPADDIAPNPFTDARAEPWLADVSVVDATSDGLGRAASLLAELGARVVRFDRFAELSPIDRLTVHAGVGIVEPDDAAVDEALHRADLVFTGPGAGPLGLTPTQIAAQAGRASIVRVVGSRFDPGAPITDLTAMAAGGHLTLNGDPADPPMHPAGDLAINQGSLVAAHAAMAALTATRRLGGRAEIEVAIDEAVALTTLQSANSNHYTWHRHVPHRRTKLADFTTVRARDGEWVSFTIHPPNWPRFVRWAEDVLGDTGLTAPEWDDPEYVTQHRSEVGAVVARLAAALDRAALVDIGQSLGLLVLPVNDVADVSADDHLRARGFFTAGPDGARLVGSPFRGSAGRHERLPATATAAPDLPDRHPADLDDGANVAAYPAADDQPLAGVRVVDFCWAIAGPLTTRLLADLGAEVIKLESEHRLDPIRYIGVQPPDAVSWDTNGTFNDRNTGKRAMTLNVDSEEGRAIAWDLIATADIVTANYSPLRLDQWGFTWAELRSRKPDLIVANLAVMGMWGPSLHWRSYGTGIVAMCGLAAHSGFPERPPECLGTLHTDFTVPFFASTYLLAALHRRDRTGEGAYLELSQYETAVRLMDKAVAGVLNGAQPPGRCGNRTAGMVLQGVYPTAHHDRWVAVACRDRDDLAAVAAVIGDSAFGRLDPDTSADELDERLARGTVERSRGDAAHRLREAGVPAAPVNDLADLRDAANPLSELWTPVTLPAGVEATIIQEPFTWNGRRLPLRPPPVWFQDTYDIVCGELGYSDDRFAELVADQVLW